MELWNGDTMSGCVTEQMVTLLTEGETVANFELDSAAVHAKAHRW